MPIKKNHFYYSYIGSKYKEIPQLSEWLPTDNKTKIIEPFAGSAAISYHLWTLGFRDIIISDRDPFLIELWNRVSNEETRIKLIKDLTKIVNKITNKEEYMTMIRNKNFISELVGSTWYNFRRNIYPENKNKPDFEEIYNRPYTNFIKDIQFKENDFRTVCDLYKNDPNAWIFIDPPYVNEDNSMYHNDDALFDMETIYLYILNLLSCKCKVLIVVSDRLLMRLLFKDYIKGSYPKQYQFSKKKVNHLIITNYNK